jgi:arylsulfatase A-like enzyme
MRRVLPALIVVGLLAVAAVFAWQSLRSGPRAVAYDLAERLPYAARVSAREVILFGWPDAEPRLGAGFGGDPEMRGRERFLWVRQGATLNVPLQEPHDRVLVFDVEAYPGIEDQKLEISVNGRSLGTKPIPSSRSRVRFDWPRPAQSDRNELKLTFSRSIVPAKQSLGSGDTRDFAAALFSLTVGDAKDRTVELLEERDTPRAYEVSDHDGVPGFILPGTSQTSFAFRLPRRATLEFESALLGWSAASGGKATLRIALDSADGRSHESVVVPLAASGLQASRIELDGDPGTPFIVRIDVVSSEPGLAFAQIRAPRILGEEVPPAPAKAENPIAAALREAKPNVVLVVLDAARAVSFGAYGHSRATTPNIDALAREAYTFDNAYTTAAYTLAAMSSVWTSQQPDRHHGDIAFSAKLPKDRLLLAEILTAQGIPTAGFVANGVAGAFNGFDRGFKEFDEPWKQFGSQASGFRNVIPGFLDRMKQGGAPFFAYVHYREPHEPYDPPAPFDTRFGPDGPITKTQRDGGEPAKQWLKDINQGVLKPTREAVDHLQRLYDGNLAFVDQEVGYLRDQLATRGLLDNTLLIVIGDHGEALFEHGWIGHNAQVFEESARVPFIVALPKSLRAAHPPARVASLVDLTDIAPTILEAFGLEGAGGSSRAFQGRSLLPDLARAGSATAVDPREVLTRTIWDRPIYALRNQSHTFVLNTATNEFSLFDRSKAGRPETPDADFGPRAPIALREMYRQHLLAWVDSLKRRTVAGDSLEGMSRQQCEELKSLGYLSGKTSCPEN